MNSDAAPIISNDVLMRLIDLVVPQSDGVSDFNLDATSVPHQNKDVTSRGFNLNALSDNFDALDVDKLNVDETRPLKGIATELVTNEFFKSEETLYQFLHLVYTSFERLLNLYKVKRKLLPYDLFFIYKGGNLLRFVSTEFELELPASATQDIRDFYAPYFKRSDSDFSIYINPHVKDYDDIYYEATLLAYLLQDRLRTEFGRDSGRYFDFFRYNIDYMRKILLPYLAEMNKVEDFKDIFIDLKIGDAAAVGDKYYVYTPNPDVTIKFVNSDEDWLTHVRKAAIAQLKLPNSLMTITHNDALDFPGSTEAVRQKFNLTRTKFIFTLLTIQGATRNIGGELIDVSVPHRLTTGLDEYFDHLDENVAKYTLKSGSRQFQLNAQSLSYLTFDLEDILFSQRIYPWVDRKYVKRVNRLMYMYFIDLFVKVNTGSKRARILFDAYVYAFKPLQDITTSSKPTALITMGKYIKLYQSMKLNITELMDRLITLTSKCGPDQLPSLSEMGGHLVKNVRFLVKTVIKVKSYCRDDGKVDLQDIYDSDIHDLV